MTLEEIETWLNAFATQCEGRIVSMNGAGEVDVKGDVALFNDEPDTNTEEITELPFKFGTIDGSFEVHHTSLITLKGFPHTVLDDVVFGGNKWSSLEHGPKLVGGNFILLSNELKTLRGAPLKVGGFFCDEEELTTLEGLPEIIDGNFDCKVSAMPNMRELNGIPPPPLDESLDYPEDQMWTISGAGIAAIKKAFEEESSISSEIQPKVETEQAAKARRKHQTGM